MTATWNLKSTDEQIPARLGFYTGPAAKPPNYETYTVQLNDRVRRFDNEFDADECALSIGVSEWRFVDGYCAFPFAALIPIRFDDALSDDILNELIAKFEYGIPLTQLATEVNTENNNGLMVSPGKLRIWMLGCQPSNPKLAGLRMKRHRKPTSNAE